MENGHNGEAVIKVRNLVVDFRSHRVLNGVSLDLLRGEILGFVGASGAGKSTLARTIIGLLPKRAGSIEVLGVDLDKADDDQKRGVDRRWGVLFQQGALFLRSQSARTSSSPSANICACPDADDRNRDRQARDGRVEPGRLS